MPIIELMTNAKELQKMEAAAILQLERYRAVAGDSKKIKFVEGCLNEVQERLISLGGE